MKQRSIHLTAVLVLVCFTQTVAQEQHHYQANFSKEEFAERRARILEVIGGNAIAVIQGSSGVAGFSVFRQSNTFYYLTGLEIPHAYLLINGKNKQTTVYL